MKKGKKRQKLSTVGSSFDLNVQVKGLIIQNWSMKSTFSFQNTFSKYHLLKVILDKTIDHLNGVSFKGARVRTDPDPKVSIGGSYTENNCT